MKFTKAWLKEVLANGTRNVKRAIGTKFPDILERNPRPG
jgi:hypothetical protein